MWDIDLAERGEVQSELSFHSDFKKPQQKHELVQDDFSFAS